MDISAFQTQGFTLTASSSSNNQSTLATTPFANPLVVTVTADDGVDPVAGGQVTFTAPSSGASATFSGNPATINANTSGGTTTYTASAMATANGTAGTYTVTAKTAGADCPVTFLLTNQPAPTTTTLTSSANPSVYGQEVTFTATVSVNAPSSGTPTGTVTFYDGNTELGTGTLSVVNGQDEAAFTTSALAVGPATITASYGGDNNYIGSNSAALTQQVNAATSSNLQTVLTTISQATFQENNNTDAQTLLNAIDSLSPPTTPVTITVNLASGNYTDVVANPPAGVTLIISGVSGSTTIVGNSPALTVLSGDVEVENGMTLTTATNAPTILVEGGSLTLNGDTVESTGNSPTALAVTSGSLTLGAGNTLEITASGQFLQAASFSGITQQAPITLEQNGSPINGQYLTLTSVSSSSPNDTSAYGQSVQLAATVTTVDGNPPSGSVEFFDATTNQVLGSASIVASNGSYQAVLSTSALSTGTHNIVATYSGDATYGLSSGSLSQTVMGSGVTVVGSALWIVGGATTNDNVQINPVGTSNTGSTGVKVDVNLNHVHTTTTYNQSFTTLYIYLYGGYENVSVAPTLTINTTVSAGKGNDNVNLGNGTNTVTLGNGNDNVTAGNGNNTIATGDGNDHVQLGNGNNTVTTGNGNDNVQVGNGNNVVVAGNGNNNIQAGNGDNLIAGGLGHDNIQAGNGNNILIDGSVSLPIDTLLQVLGDWIDYGSTKNGADLTYIDSVLLGSVTFNNHNANTLHAGSGLDWFWASYAKDKLNNKSTDMLN